ncbi:Hypothetical protein NTJ_02179 [Nesidiocoris tenuis]|nr:Hypothetical protein NTJ_02179 [Nesidiocoris tenuis]
MGLPSLFGLFRDFRGRETGRKDWRHPPPPAPTREGNLVLAEFGRWADLGVRLITEERTVGNPVLEEEKRKRTSDTDESDRLPLQREQAFSA